MTPACSADAAGLGAIPLGLGSRIRPVLTTVDDSCVSHLGFVHVIKQTINPRADLPDRLTSSGAIQLFVEDVVVAELDRPRHESTCLARRCRWSQACISESAR